MSTSTKYNKAVSEMQFAAHQHQLHLTTINTLTVLLKEIQDDPDLAELKKLTARALVDFIKPFTKPTIETNDIIGE